MPHQTLPTLSYYLYFKTYNADFVEACEPAIFVFNPREHAKQIMIGCDTALTLSLWLTSAFFSNNCTHTDAIISAVCPS